jgi:hypothetical protein
MTDARTSGLTLLLLLGILCCITATANATAETFNLPARQTTVRTVDLNVDDEVSGRISVVSSDESNDITFMVYGPLGSIVLPPTTVVANNFDFKVTEAGTYSFVFDNSLSTGDKTVSLNYDVRHYWFGMPQEFVLMLIVVFLGVLGLVVYAMASRKQLQ